jgi:hypothetical protein
VNPETLPPGMLKLMGAVLRITDATKMACTIGVSNTRRNRDIIVPNQRIEER